MVFLLLVELVAHGYGTEICTCIDKATFNPLGPIVRKYVIHFNICYMFHIKYDLNQTNEEEEQEVEEIGLAAVLSFNLKNITKKCQKRH